MQEQRSFTNRPQNNRGSRETLHAKVKPKYEGKGHDALLRKHIESKAKLNIRLTDGEWVIGTIVAADKYTITISTPRPGKEEDTFDGTMEMTIFKHGIATFFAEKGE